VAITGLLFWAFADRLLFSVAGFSMYEYVSPQPPPFGAMITILCAVAGGMVTYATHGELNEQFHTDVRKNPRRIVPKEVAAMVPAHNEEESIADTLATLRRILPAENIYVGSDASTDRTVEVAKGFGCTVADIHPNRGKASVLVCLLNTYDLYDRYKAVMIVDADAAVDKDYLRYALPLFDDPQVVAVAGHGATRLPADPWRLRWAMFFLSYRVRLWRIVQFGMRYGQTWKYTNTTYIVPGSPSMYRTSALKQIYIDAPGLVIEDFNMTFELHHKKLGRVAYDPRVGGVHHDPYTFRDYRKQIRRWNLGFWQTALRHGFWPSAFWFSTFFFMLELYFFSLFIVAVPLILAAFALNGFVPLTLPILTALTWSARLSFSDLFIGVFLVDYLMTVIAGSIERKPYLLFYGIGFFLLRYVDALTFVYTLPLAFFTKSDGRWASPARKTAASAA
jgi:cellulose synthase/poly-beta-1,6-N-acetylglucosamine synthase-like glycosyltransferase